MKHRSTGVFLLELVLLINLAACSTASTSLAPSSTPVLPPTVESDALAADTLTPLPSETPEPTLTLTPTLSPTPPFLVQASTPFPLDLSPITFENASQVSGLAELQDIAVTDMDWVPNSTILAVSNGTGINMYDIQTRQVLRALYPRAEGVVDLAFSPDGDWLVSGSRRGSVKKGYASSLELWAGPNWKPLGIMFGVDRALSGLTFLPNGKLMAGAFTSTNPDLNGIAFWNSLTWAITGTVGTGTILDLAFSPDSTLLATTPDRYAILVWDMTQPQGKQKKPDALYKLHTSFTGAVTQLAFSPDSSILASGHYDGTIRLWDMRTGKLLMTIQSDEVIQSLTFSPDGRLLASGGSYQDNQVRLWSAGSGKLLNSLDGHNHGVDFLLFSPSSQYLVSASYDGEIRIWGIRP